MEDLGFEFNWRNFGNVVYPTLSAFFGEDTNIHWSLLCGVMSTEVKYPTHGLIVYKPGTQYSQVRKINSHNKYIVHILYISETQQSTNNVHKSDMHVKYQHQLNTYRYT